jgi:uncharacterized Zn finger protein
VKKQHDPLTRRNDGITELASQIEAEISGGSREALQQLLAKLAASDDDSEEAEGYRRDEFDEAPYPGRIVGPDDGKVSEESDGFDEPGPYWWRRTAGRRAAPLEAEGGLHTRNQRGQIGETWWSRRFLEAVESALVGSRLARGRAYARRGQVVELDIAAGLISARVQGSRPTPYKVRVAMPAVRDDEWERIFVSLASQASYCASLLAGELPHEVESVFAEAGVTMLPSPTSRLTTGCTCPDWANPCKHVAAVCYLVAERFDLDPFAVLAWRGQDRAAALRRLRELRGVTTHELPEVEPPPAMPLPPLSECLASFWQAGPALASVHVRPRASESAGAVLRQWPRGLLEVGGKDLGELLGDAYKEMAASAQRRALSSAKGDSPEQFDQPIARNFRYP